MKLVLLGPPGAGKGTQVGRLAERLHLQRISSGDLFRDHQRRDTELGRLARGYMERGALVPDEVTIRMVSDWLEVPGREDGFLLDGFPRTLAQAEALDRILASRGGVDKVLHIRVGREQLVARLSGRMVCSVCQAPYHRVSAPPREADRCDRCGGALYQRADDAEKAVRKRLQVYEEETAPLVEHYRAAGKLAEVDGEDSIDGVTRSLEAVLGR